jgi:hypothetical protein
MIHGCHAEQGRDRQARKQQGFRRQLPLPPQTLALLRSVCCHVLGIVSFDPLSFRISLSVYCLCMCRSPRASTSVTGQGRAWSSQACPSQPPLSLVASNTCTAALCMLPRVGDSIAYSASDMSGAAYILLLLLQKLVKSCALHAATCLASSDLVLPFSLQVSEGIDFSDRAGRGVVITGLPFPAAPPTGWRKHMRCCSLCDAMCCG